MQLGYITNGFAHHTPHEAIEVLHTIGYQAVGITIDHSVLSPHDPNWREQAKRLREQTEQHGMTVVIETGARFLLDPWVKHRPTLVSETQAERAGRVEFLKHAVLAAKVVGSKIVSLWAGVAAPDTPEDILFERLTTKLLPLLQFAAEHGVTLAFEPEPGMAIETLSQFAKLKEQLSNQSTGVDDSVSKRFRLTADIGHLHCLGETPIAEHLKRHASELRNLHIEDMCHGVHEHLEFGSGEIGFPPVIDALAEVGYAGPLCVELSRHSHDAPNAARRAYEFLMPLIEATQK